MEDWTIEGETAVHIAVRRGHVRALEVLLSCLEHTKSKHILNWLDCRGYTVLHVAAAANNYEVVSLLMKKVNVNLKTSGSEGLKAINLATDQRVIDMLRSEELASTKKPQNSFKTRLVRRLLGDREEVSSIEQLNAVLVVAALIVTATFQALLSPPGGISSGGDSSYVTNTSVPPGRVQLRMAVFNIFLYVNTIAFVSSLMTIELVLQKAHNSRLLRVSIFFLSICYGFSLAIMLPRTRSTPYRVFSYGLSAIGGFGFLMWVI